MPEVESKMSMGKPPIQNDLPVFLLWSLKFVVALPSICKIKSQCTCTQTKLSYLHWIQSQRFQIHAYIVSQFTDRISTDFYNQFWNRRPVLIKSNPQYLKRIIILVAGMKQNSRFHGRMCHFYPFWKRNTVITQPGGSVYIRR